MKREEAEHIAEQERMQKEMKREAGRRKTDLGFEKKDLEALLEDPNVTEEDAEFAVQRIQEITDELEMFREQEEEADRQMAAFEAEQTRIAQER